MTPKAERLDRIYKARGVDYFPSWARSPVDYWAADMPIETARRELGFAAAMGFDHVRCWLSAWGYEQDPAAYITNLRSVLDAATQHGIGVVMELFDSCGTEPSRGSESTVRIADVPQLADGSPSLAAIKALAARGDRDLFIKPGLVEVPWRGDAMVAVWEGFVPSPGYDYLGKEHWERWDAYARAIAGAFDDHPALWLLSVMNEPFVTQIGQQVDTAPIVDFYRHMVDVVRDAGPRLPISIGCEQSGIQVHHDNCPDVDVVSFHSLDGPAALAHAVAAAVDVAGGRPLYLSEWGYFPGGTDEDQLREIETLLPLVEEAGIGWAYTHLIAGYGPFANTALLYPSGVMRPGALHLRNHLLHTESTGRSGR